MENNLLQHSNGINQVKIVSSQRPQTKRKAQYDHHQNLSSSSSSQIGYNNSPRVGYPNHESCYPQSDWNNHHLSRLSYKPVGNLDQNNAKVTIRPTKMPVFHSNSSISQPSNKVNQMSQNNSLPILGQKIENRKTEVQNNNKSPPTPSSPSPKEDARRKQHNEVERRRRDKINRWIIELGKIVPSCQVASGDSKGGSSDSKGGILQKTYQHLKLLMDQIKQLEDQPSIPENASVDQMVQFQNTRIQNMASEINQLKKELIEARSDRDDIIEQLSRQGIKIKFKDSNGDKNMQSARTVTKFENDYSSCGVDYEVAQNMDEIPKTNNEVIQQSGFGQNHESHDFMTNSVEYSDQSVNNYEEPIEIGNHDFASFDNRSHQGSLTTAQQIEFFSQH